MSLNESEKSPMQKPPIQKLCDELDDVISKLGCDVGVLKDRLDGICIANKPSIAAAQSIDTSQSVLGNRLWDAITKIENIRLGLVDTIQRLEV
jgi:hypothetical protein